MEKFIPNGAKGKEVKYFAVSAHKDDVEMMALDGIIKGFGDFGFAAAVLTHGGACPRGKGYEDLSETDMSELRTAEQKRAAEKGCYEALYLFEKSSDDVKRKDESLVNELAQVLSEYPRLDALYLHNIFDRHPTHVAACLTALRAVRLLDEDKKPEKIYGCEVWRDLDWLPAKYKTIFDVRGYEKFSAEIMDCFISQNAVKRYDVASLARRKANATYFESHAGDESDALIFAVDITRLGKNDADEALFAENILETFKKEILNNLQ